jgi:hypothetical protein
MWIIAWLQSVSSGLVQFQYIPVSSADWLDKLITEDGGVGV